MADDDDAKDDDYTYACTLPPPKQATETTADRNNTQRMIRCNTVILASY